MSDLENTKYNVQFTSRFKKEFKKMLKQGKDENLFLEVLNVIANGGKLAEKYKNHKLNESLCNIKKIKFESTILTFWAATSKTAPPLFCTTKFLPPKICKIQTTMAYLT